MALQFARFLQEVLVDSQNIKIFFLLPFYSQNLANSTYLKKLEEKNPLIHQRISTLDELFIQEY
jgi:hypothetical protein